jgi:hypothetical protein
MIHQYINPKASIDYRCTRVGYKNKLIESSSLKFIGMPPPILIFNLARFKYDETLHVFKKNNDRVTFNFENESFTSLYGNDQPALYNLVGVVCHIGDSLLAGHYIAYVIENGNWYYYSDQVRKKADIEDLSLIDYIYEKAYLLFYEVSTMPKNKHAKIQDSLENSFENQFSQLSVSESGKLETPEKMRSDTTRVFSPRIGEVLNCSFKNKSIQEELYMRIDEEDNVDQDSQEEDNSNDESEHEDLCGDENFKIVNGV